MREKPLLQYRLGMCCQAFDVARVCLILYLVLLASAYFTVRAGAELNLCIEAAATKNTFNMNGTDGFDCYIVSPFSA